MGVKNETRKRAWRSYRRTLKEREADGDLRTSGDQGDWWDEEDRNVPLNAARPKKTDRPVGGRKSIVGAECPLAYCDQNAG